MSGLVIFSAETLDEGRVEALYGTDGTADGTMVIADFRDPAFGIVGAGDDVEIRDLSRFGDGVVFGLEIGNDETWNWYLGFSDGTAAGTVLFGGGEPGPSGSPYFPIDGTLEHITVSGDTLAYIVETSGRHDRLVLVKADEGPTVFDAADLATGATEIDAIIGNGSGRFAVSVALPSEQAVVLTDGTDFDVVATRSSEFDDDGEEAMLWLGDTFIYGSDAPDTLTAVDATNVASTESVTFDDVSFSSISVVDGGVALSADAGGGTGREPHF